MRFSGIASFGGGGWVATLDTASPAGGRINARLMLARFYLAHGFAAEAIGTLENGVREDNQMLTRPLYFLLRGLAELGMGRPEVALKLLKNDKVADVAEAANMRAAAYADMGMWTLARDSLRVGVVTLSARVSRQIFPSRSMLGSRAIDGLIRTAAPRSDRR